MVQSIRTWTLGSVSKPDLWLRDRDGQFFYVPRPQSLTDDVGATHDHHVLVACSLDGSSDSVFQAVHEVEAGAFRLITRTVGQDQEGHTERIAAAPGAR